MTIRIAASTVAIALSIALSITAKSASAQNEARFLGPTVRQWTVPLLGAREVRVLADGRVLVNELARTLLLNATLERADVVLDSTRGRPRYGVVLAFAGDSSLLYDPAANAFVVITPEGGLGRTIAGATGMELLPPARRSGGLPVDGGLYFGTPGPFVFSPTLGIVYTVYLPMPAPQPGTGGVPMTGAIRLDAYVAVLAYDLATGRVDTLSRIATGFQQRQGLNQGRATSFRRVAPLFPFMDDAVVTSTGVLAVYRAKDYRLERVDRGGAVTPSASMPFAWRPLPDSARTRIVDSVNTDRTLRWAADTRTVAARAATGVPVGNVNPPDSVTLTDVPTRRPPTGWVPLIADAEGRVWIQQLRRNGDESSRFDVFAVDGRLVGRVVVAPNETVIGFGRGTVFLEQRSTTSILVEKRLPF